MHTDREQHRTAAGALSGPAVFLGSGLGSAGPGMTNPEAF